MTKIRVYELAKELGMESKDVIRRLKKMGEDVKNHMSTVEDQHADMLRDIMRPKLADEMNRDKNSEKKEAAPAASETAKSKETTEDTPTRSEHHNEPPVKIAKESQEKSSKNEVAENEATKEHEAKSAGSAKVSEEKPSVKAPVQKPHIHTERAETDQPRQQGVFQKRNNQPRQQGVFAQNHQRRQGDFRNNNGGYQNRNNDRQQGNFQNRGQGRNNDRQQGNFRNNNSGGYQNRNHDHQQGNFQNRSQGQQGNFQNRANDRQQNRFQGQNHRERLNAVPPPPEGLRPQDKKDSRRFEQKKKNNFYDSRKKDFDRHNFENMRHRPNPKHKKAKKEEMPPVVPKTVVIGETVVISELAKSMSKTAAELIKKLFDLGYMATVNQEIDAETAQILGTEFGISVEVKVDKTLEMMEDDVDDESTLVERPPVVTVMGHVDHGKTSLLDAIRKTNVIANEAGGITQHIGAYQVEISGKKITFLDTPGHEAFTSMRARGAQVTDIAVLVVAADDGVMPQTIEAINHAKAADVPIIVAINKIDKPGASVDKIRQELTEYGLVDEEWGGNTIMVPVSAKKNEGIQNLLEMILLVAEVAELKSNPNRNARGTIIEAQLDKGRGAVATVLVQKGTLHVGDILVAGTEFAKVRAMIDDKGRRTKSATPSTPVEILGFSNVPPAGEIFVCVDDEKDARHIAEHNSTEKREKDMGKNVKVSLDDLFKQISEGTVKELNIVLKADVHGSVEALAQSIRNLSTDEVRVNIIHSGVGAIVETDVMLAEASNAIIIGFNVRPDAHTKKAAEKAGVDIRMYRVIYEALDSIKAAMSGLLDPEFKEVIVGHVEVRDVIKVPKVGIVAGSYVVDGKVIRNGKVRLLRNGIVIHEGDISSLRRFKDDVKEVATGYECGICIENFNDIKIDDQMEIYMMEETKRQID